MTKQEAAAKHLEGLGMNFELVAALESLTGGERALVTEAIKDAYMAGFERDGAHCERCHRLELEIHERNGRIEQLRTFLAREAA